MSLSGTLQVGRTALAVTQAAIQTHGNNIAGASDPNYSRQVISASSTPGKARGDGIILGTGVQLDAVERQVDDALLRRLNAASSDAAAANEVVNWLSQAEATFNELSDADLSTGLTRFFNTWGELANNPADAALRRNVLNEGATLAKGFNDLHARLSRLSSDAGERIGGYATEADRIAREIAGLNVQIAQGEGATGGMANALRDRRDALVGELSQYVGVHAIEQGDGTLNLYAGSEPLVMAGTSRGLELEQRVDAEGRPTFQAIFSDGGGPIPARSGKLSGALASRSTINDTLDRIDALAQNLKFELNGLHAQGQGTAGYDSVTSEVVVADAAVPLDDDATMIDPAPRNGSFVVHLRDKASGSVKSTVVEVHLDGTAAGTSLDDLASDLTAIPGVTASVSAGKLTIKADSAAQELAFGEDSANVLPALGIAGFFSGKGAADLSVDAKLLADPRRLATSVDNTPGGNGLALKVAALGETGLPGLAGATINQAYEATVFEVAAGVRSAQTDAEASGAIGETLELQRQSLSGVSLDEEAVQLLRYQRSYQGAARLVAAVDEMMQTLLQLV